ncbi:hypothetical protein GALMADRAFT_231803 [Galerina marginata CBS 339.88]|uniref:Uncharacterized protein n=1 Tax=Galerina marginata (strain CBS 339.88) TaxID=685588 RepID=A0A067SCA6_GALM3|nr:hypothetical protein GALMADRAFT_231803 [Galerina marginata CBS 339.88]
MPLRLDLPGNTPTYRRNGALGRRLSAQPRPTLVSKDFRFLVLRRFFYRIKLEDHAGSRALLDYLAEVDKNYGKLGWTAGYFWVRSLSSPSFLIVSNAKDLNFLTHLKDFCIDFSHSSVVLQRSSLDHLFKALTAQLITKNLTSLMLTSVPRIDIHLLGLVAKSFPGLTNIHLSSIEALDMTCCPNCYEDSLTRIFHSPIPDIYQDITSLATAFGSALGPLKNLTHLYMGIFLSQTDLLDLHINHGTNDDIRPVTFETVYNCARCERFRTSTKQGELLASLILAQHLESLKYIGWSSCFGPRVASEGERDGQEENTIGGDTKRGDAKEEGRTNLYMPHDFKTGLAIDRAAGKIKITRML